MARSGILFGLISLIASPAAASSTWYVDAAGGGPGSGAQLDPYTSLQYAIAQPTTMDGDTLLVAAGVYFEHIDLLGKTLHIAGDGAGQTFLDGSGTGRVVDYSPGSGGVLRDLTIQNGWAMQLGDDRGGGVWIRGASPELRRVIVRNCVAQSGGGIAVDLGSPHIVESSIRFNGAPAPLTTAGAGIWAACSASPLVEDCDITFNRDTQFGGGVAGAGTYRRCHIDDNVARRGGGAHALGCALNFEGCSIRRNLAASTLGDLFEGGGVIGPATLTDCAIEDNIANYEGGGALSCHLTRCSLRGNLLDNFATFSVVARGAGAARSTLVDCEVEFNQVGGGLGGFDYLRGDGAGVWNCTVVDSVLRANLARNGSGGGAADSVLTNCELAENEARLGMDAATGRGGAATHSTLTRCIVTENLAEHGGGAAESTLEFCTLVDNVASASGGALFVEAAPVLVNSSIAWSNTPDEFVDLSGALIVSYSAVDGGWPGVANLAVDPLFFAPLARDLHLKPASPCINAADPNAAFDPDGSRADIGALTFNATYCATPVAYCTGKVNSQGCTPTISSTGSTSLSAADPLVIHCSQVVEDKAGFLFWGFQPLSAPFANGVRCVGIAIRTTFQSSSGEPPPATCTGAYHFAFMPAYVTAVGLIPGATLYSQWYSRDPGHLDGTGLSLSNALEATLCP